nr:hypothetical protein [Vibrio parahaemolyticus]
MADFKQFGRRLLLGAALYAPLTMAAEKELGYSRPSLKHQSLLWWMTLRSTILMLKSEWFTDALNQACNCLAKAT